ncbi:MAG TPA: tRNA isopentenyl-2-thiomethyl-A-37 hydroxylase MiaE [Pseudomonadales bacterium]
MTDLSNIKAFLACDTPDAWLLAARQHRPELLIDHANCEKKAAATAMNLLYRYIDKPDLLRMLSQLAREELLHFEQVLGLMDERSVVYRHLPPSRYASVLRGSARTHEPAKLIDTLIIGALIEARSCERFARLAEVAGDWGDESLGKYYRFLLRSESRHFEDYLALAEQYSDQPIADRIAHFTQLEKTLIESPDDEFRFHSGVPIDIGLS